MIRFFVVPFRLGGGVFCDTYAADLNDDKIVVKRLNVGTQHRKITRLDFQYIIQKVEKLRYFLRKYIP